MSKPNYKNLLIPAADTVVTRYLSLAGLALIIARQELPLIRLGLFRDPFEGSAPESVMNQQLLIQGSRNMQLMQMHAAAGFYRQQMMGWGDDGSGRGYELPDVFVQMAKVRKARVGASYASCWQWGPESEGMWRLYCGDREGIALSTTFGQLEKSIADDEVLAGQVRYVDYKTVQPFDDNWDYVLHKREGFRHEQEVRLIKLDAELHERLLAQEPVIGSDCMNIPWDIFAGVEKILISPYAADWYFDAVCATTSGLGGTALAERVGWSDLRAMAKF